MIALEVPGRLRAATLILNLTLTLALVGAAPLSANPALAQDTPPPSANPPGNADALPEVVVVGHRTAQDKVEALDDSRDNFLLPKSGATTYGMDHETIEALPQGENTPIDKVILQAPGVAYDSAISNPSFHIRSEYSNVQYRINGVPLPFGISGLGPVLETGFVGNLNLLDGVLPAQYGLRTSGVIDITTKSTFETGGSMSLYGGSQATISPRLEYGGTVGETQYFFTGRYLQSNEGLENATASVSPIHDHTEQGKFFGYASTLLNDSSRLTYMLGGATGQFQIPNIPGQQPLGDFGGMNVNSATLNERESDDYFFNVLALQTKGDRFDTQLSFFSAYAAVHFMPDVYKDLAFDDAASNVSRKSYLNGINFDGASQLTDTHTLRAGFGVSAEETQVVNGSTVLPLDGSGNPLATPETLTDANSRLGWNLGLYVQDEWKLTDKLTLNTGLRFDQLYQFVQANQLSPRVSLTYTPFDSTALHVGYARYFTPPSQVQATPTNLGLFQNTTLQPDINADNPARPERSHYFDVGIDQTIATGLTVGSDVYYKIATDFLDDGQFGQAVVLTQFNYAHAYSEGVEFKAKYRHEGFTAYANLAVNTTKARDVVTNQFLFDPVEFAYLSNHYIYTDDAQTITGSTGASFRWDDMLVSTDAIYGSGLRTGFANLQAVPAYLQVNLGVSRKLDLWSSDKPLTVGFNVVNLFDESYLLRSGSGVGDFAPQYGPRRGFFFTLSQKL